MSKILVSTMALIFATVLFSGCDKQESFTNRVEELESADGITSQSPNRNGVDELSAEESDSLERIDPDTLDVD